MLIFLEDAKGGVNDNSRAVKAGREERRRLRYQSRGSSSRTTKPQSSRSPSGNSKDTFNERTWIFWRGRTCGRRACTDSRALFDPKGASDDASHEMLSVNDSFIVRSGNHHCGGRMLGAVASCAVKGPGA